MKSRVGWRRLLLRRLVNTSFVLLTVISSMAPLLVVEPVAAARPEPLLENDTAASDQENSSIAASDAAYDADPDIANVTLDHSSIEGSVDAANANVAPATLAAPDLSPAYIQDVDLGNGERNAIISSDPVRYLAANGEWKPIDPTFAQEVDGFYNRTNLMTVQSPARQAQLQVNYSELAARWTPLALALVNPTGEQILATPHTAKPDVGQMVAGELAANGRTVSYANGWSMAGLIDEIVSGAGEAEQNLLFTQPPVLAGQVSSPDAKLVLRARLELPPGAQLLVNGVEQKGVFSTTNTIVMRNHEGTTSLNLTPARLFEKNRPDQSLVATYQVRPIDLRSWEVSMETPLSWWSDPARQYPVVWDPMMQVLRAINVAQVYQNPACGPFLAERPDAVGVGRATCWLGIIAQYSPVRTLLQFTQINKLNLPPLATIQGAILMVAPYDGYINYTSYGEYDPCVNTRLHPITQSWDPNTVNWQNQPSVGQAFVSSSTSYQGRNDPPLCFKPEPYSYNNSGTKYLLQNGASGLVSDWIQSGTNFGLELRAREDQENGCDPRFGCDFVQMPKRSVWPLSDRNLFFGNDFEAVEGGGFMLIVRYKGPQLVDNVPYRFDAPVPIPPKPADEDFHRTGHVYTPPVRPNTNPQWLAVGSKGFRKEILFDAVPKTGLFSYAYWGQTGEDPALSVRAALASTVQVSATQPSAIQGDQVTPAAVNVPNAQAYAFAMAVATEECSSPACEMRSEGSGNTDGSNFLLVNANSAQGREVRINSLKADPDLEVYAVEGSWSKEIPPITAAEVSESGVRRQYTVTVGSEHIVQAYNLPLPENVRVRIATSVTVEGVGVPSSPAITHLFPPSTGIYPKTAQHPKNSQTSALTTLIPAGRGGNYGLVLELPGDKTAFDLCNGEICDGQVFDREPKDRTLQVVFNIQVCPVNSIPTETGCALVILPHFENPDLYRVVGPYVVFSPSGFLTNIGPCLSTTCSLRYKDGKEYATIITWGFETKRMAIVAGNSILGSVIVSLKDTVGQEMILSYGIWALGKADGVGGVAPFFLISEGFFKAGFSGDDYGYFYDADCDQYQPCNAVNALSQYDQADIFIRNFSVVKMRINMQQDANDNPLSQYAEMTASISRPVQTVNGEQKQNFTIVWRVQAEGYRGWLDSPQGTGPLNVTLTPTNGTDAAPVAGLSYQFGNSWEAYYSEVTGAFSEFRNNEGRIVQPANLGGAWNYVDYVILDFGKAPSGGDGLAMCPGFCGDVRAPTDTWTAPNRQWKMPDILVNQLPNTVMVSSPGTMQVYSSDHPASLGQANESYGLAFKTFGAKVELTDGVCPGGASDQPVALIKGTTSLALPGIDPNADPNADASAIPSITASFVLCENILRQVNITFKYPPGIPVAAPPVLYVDMIGGTVTIGPDHVVISIDVGFYIGTGAPQIVKGIATLTLDTRGLFDMQMKGRVMGTMDAEGHLWVAWNPLDLGIGSQGWLPNKNDWVISGFIYAHAWRGSGWQNKYPWLAGNDDFHLTSSLQATFKIAEGAAVDEWPLVIPPDDISIGVELSFGQFCANDGCTDFEWGIKGKVTIIGFDVGIFVNLECPALLAAVVFPPAVLLCSSFILGSDDHLLIDQYGGNGPPFPLEAITADSNGSPGDVPSDALTDEQSVDDDESALGRARDARLASANRISVADPNAADVDHALTVKSSASSILVAFGWVRGAPKFTLVRPDGKQITAANAASMGAAVSTTTNSVIFGIQDPTAGKWIARVTNAIPTSDYRIMYFANKATPTMIFTAPNGIVNVNAAGDSTAAQLYQIQWTPPANANQLSMSLYYSTTVLNPTSASYQYGGVIREDIDPSTGSYDWDLSHLASGDYRIFATLQDKKGAKVSEFGTDQYVGVSTSLAQGTLRYVDAVAPPMPDVSDVTYLDGEDGVTICWDVDPAHDLSEYILTYTIFDTLYPVGRNVGERILATVPYAADARQCTRVGGLVMGESVVDFIFTGNGLAAKDASGNVSGVAKPADISHMTQATGRTLFGPEAPILTGTVSSAVANLSWDSAIPATGYDLFYPREAYAGPQNAGSGATEGASPIHIDSLVFNGNYTVSGLSPGYWYAFAVRRYSLNSQAPPSLLSNQVWLLITSGTDSNGDGCPDDWEAAHKPYNGKANPDGDGLTTAQECKIGTNPKLPDSDGDATIDGVELQEGSKPLDPGSVPTPSSEDYQNGVVPPHPAILALAEANLTFIAYAQSPNPAAQSVGYMNAGAGSFKVSVSDNRSWLSASVNSNRISIAIDKSKLARGTFNGVVQVNANPASTLQSPQLISVELIVLAGSDPNFKQTKTYLPGVRR